MEQSYLVKIGQQVIGEFSLVEIQQQLRTGKFTRLHRVSGDGGQTWESVHHVAQPQVAPAGQAEPAGSQTPGESDEEMQDAPADSDQQVEQWYVTMATGEQVGEKYGPFTKDEVAMWVQQGRVVAADLVWAESLDDWKPVYMVFDTPNAEDAQAEDKLGFLKTIFKSNVPAQPKKKIPKQEQSWSIICIAAAISSFTWLGGLGSIAGIVLSVIGLFEVLSSKGYKRGVIPCLVGLLLGIPGILFSWFILFSN
jgi:hypothetical protein